MSKLSKQVINIGVKPNDGTGDQIREAFRKTNQNFDILFSAAGLGASLIGYTGGTVSNNLDLLNRSILPVNPTGSDDTANIQAALSTYGRFRAQPGATYTVTNTITFRPGDNYLELNGATINASFGTNYSKPLFSSDTTSTHNVYFKDMKVLGNCLIFNLQFSTANPGNGMKIDGSGLSWNTLDGNRRAGTGVLFGEQIDAVNLTDIFVFNSDFIFKIGGTFGRGCTQIRIKNVLVGQVNTGAIFQAIDKLTIDGFDIATCNSGFVWVGANTRHNCRNLHVEALSPPGYSSPSTYAPASASGYGYYFADLAQNNAIRIAQSSLIDTNKASGTALGGIYIGNCISSALQDITFEGCSIPTTSENSTSYKPIVNRGRLNWRGAWPYTTEPSLGANGLNIVDNIIDDYVTGIPGTINLLGGTTVYTLLTSWTSINGAATLPTFTELTYNSTGIFGYRVTFNTAGYPLSRAIILAAGWHTVYFRGKQISGNPILHVQVNGSGFTEIVKLQITNTTDAITRACFYNTATQAIRVGITNQAIGDTVDVYEIGVSKGFVTTPPQYAGAHIVPSLPTASEQWSGKQVQVRATGSNDQLHVCTKNSSSTFIWTQLV